ncbi:hypothetical protein AURDEDRAFT_114506, partial [Auricularia subglabra TFB-10046 SS5]
MRSPSWRTCRTVFCLRRTSWNATRPCEYSPDSPTSHRTSNCYLDVARSRSSWIPNEDPLSRVPISPFLCGSPSCAQWLLETARSTQNTSRRSTRHCCTSSSGSCLVFFPSARRFEYTVSPSWGTNTSCTITSRRRQA